MTTKDDVPVMVGQRREAWQAPEVRRRVLPDAITVTGQDGDTFSVIKANGRTGRLLGRTIATRYPVVVKDAPTEAKADDLAKREAIPAPAMCPVGGVGAEGRRRGLAVGLKCTCDGSAFKCCGGTDEHPPEHTQDCATRAAPAPSPLEVVRTSIMGARQYAQGMGGTNTSEDLTNALAALATLEESIRAEERGRCEELAMRMAREHQQRRDAELSDMHARGRHMARAGACVDVGDAIRARGKRGA